MPRPESDPAYTAGGATDVELADAVASLASADAILTTAAADAQATADAALPKAGGTMTGKIVLDGDPTQSLHPATRQYVLAEIAALVNGAPGILDTLGEIAAQLGTDESAVAALTATVAGKLSASLNLSDLTNAGTARTNLGLGTAATHAHGDYDASGAAAAAQAASQPLDSDLTAIAALTTTTFGRALLETADAAAARTALAIAPIQPSYTVGEYYAVRGAVSGAGAGAPTLNRVHYLPLLVNKTTTFDRIASYITAAGSAGAVDRMGIYSDDGAGKPGTLILGAGTVATDTGANSIRAITISQQLTPGFYWVAIVAQVAAAPNHNRIAPFTEGGFLNANLNGNVLVQDSMTGALASNPSGLYAAALNPPVVALRAA